MADRLIRGITVDGFVQVCAVECTGMVERARQIHGTLPLATAALGRTLAACSMMGSMLKSDEGSLTIQVRGGGPLGAITAVADTQGNTRGYLQNPAVSLPLRPDGKLDVGGGVGREGLLTVIKDIGAGGFDCDPIEPGVFLHHFQGFLRGVHRLDAFGAIERSVDGKAAGTAA